jgi:hypothetical protein
MIIAQNIMTQRRVTRKQGSTEFEILNIEDWF